jgi:hypothetical protein
MTSRGTSQPFMTGRARTTLDHCWGKQPLLLAQLFWVSLCSTQSLGGHQVVRETDLGMEDNDVDESLVI